MQLLLAMVLAAIAVAERVPRLRFERSAILRPGVGTDLVCLATGALALGLAMRHAAARLVDGGGAALPELGRLPAPLAVALATVLYDLGAYAAHLLMHRSEALWRLHQVHHSSPTLDWLATFRAHVLEHALRHAASPVLLLLVGFPVATVAAAGAIYVAWAALNHANLRVAPRLLEAVFMTPRLHRLHHAPRTCDRNLGTIFSVWDRMRGTLVAAPDAPRGPLGVPGRLAAYPQGWLGQLVEPFRRSAGASEAPREPGAAIRCADGRTWGA